MAPSQISEINSNDRVSAWIIPRRLLFISLTVTALVLLIATILVAAKWPFSREALTRELEGLGEGTVQIGGFKTTYFPPGCVAQNVTFRAPGETNSQLPITVEKMTIIGSYLGMFERPKHIRHIELEHLKIFKAPGGKLTKPSRKATLIVDDLLATDAELNIPLGREQAPLRFQIRRLSMRHLQANQPFLFTAAVRLPKPVSDVMVNGRAGPVNDAEPGRTPLAGDFLLENADLGVFHGIAGKVSGKGQFRGELGRLEVNGDTSMPALILRSTDHGLPLSTKFHAVVDGTNGDVTLDEANAILGETAIHSTGRIVKDGNDRGKTVSLRMSGQNGRIQDLLYLFVHSDSPIAGTTSFNTTVELKPKPGRFVEKVVLDAIFGIDSRFTKPSTQQKINTLSERAQGDTKDNGQVEVISDLRGHVRLENGVAHFSKLAVTVPGASVDLHGTFNVETQVVNLRGMLRTDVKLSDATTGFKAFLLKVMEFAKQKKRRGALVPVKITGTYSKPSFDIDAPKEK